ncbi:MAG: hypothetical protein K1X56_07015 [Flavobacteriales bacterium]|nr:hypothetical protein [Flavobacteriales bacterium]
MKKSILFFTLLLVSAFAQAQFTIDSPDFSAKFKSLFELAKKRWTTEKTGTKKDISEYGFVAQYNATTTFNQSQYSRIVVDKDGIFGHDTRFKIGADKAAAKRVLSEMTEIIKANMPAKFLLRDSWDENYLDGTAYVVEYDSEIFAQQAKQPSARIGIREVNGSFVIDLTIFEPIFK